MPLAHRGAGAGRGQWLSANGGSRRQEGTSSCLQAMWECAQGKLREGLCPRSLLSRNSATKRQGSLPEGTGVQGVMSEVFLRRIRWKENTVEQDGGGARRRLSSNEIRADAQNRGDSGSHKDKTPRKAGWEPSAREPSPRLHPPRVCTHSPPSGLWRLPECEVPFSEEGVQSSHQLLNAPRHGSLPPSAPIPASLPIGSIQ